MAKIKFFADGFMLEQAEILEDDAGAAAQAGHAKG